MDEHCQHRQILCGQLLVFKQFETMTFKYNCDHDYINKMSDKDIECIKIWLRMVVANYNDVDLSNKIILGNTFVYNIIYGEAVAL